MKNYLFEFKFSAKKHVDHLHLVRQFFYIQVLKENKSLVGRQLSKIKMKVKFNYIDPHCASVLIWIRILGSYEDLSGAQ